MLVKPLFIKHTIFSYFTEHSKFVVNVHVYHTNLSVFLFEPVEAFNNQKDIVTLGKRITSQFSMVRVQVGNVMAMPYKDNMFDVAVSMFVRCNIIPKVLSKHFKELFIEYLHQPWLAEQSFGKFYLTVGQMTPL